MAQFVHIDSEMDFDAISFAQPHPRMVEFMRSTIPNPSQALTDAARSFYQRSMNMFEHFSGHDAVRRTRAAMRKIQHVFMPDDLREYTTISQMQQAQPQMQRFLMANPFIRNMYQQQSISGYEGHYVDMQPGAIGVTHYDYGQIMSGRVVVTNEDEGEYEITTIFDDTPEDDPTPVLEAQVDVTNSWDNMNIRAQRGMEDPTDEYCGII